MGVPTVWIIDPNTRSDRMCSGAEWIASERLEISANPIYVRLDELFSQIDGPIAR